MSVYDMEDVDKVNSETASARVSMWRPAGEVA